MSSAGNPNPKLRRTSVSSDTAKQINFSSDTSKQINFSSDTSKQSQFPADLIEEILVSLGVKSLLRFKCVSRQWLSLLSHPQFITGHLKTMKARQDFIVMTRERKFGIGTLCIDSGAVFFRQLETLFPVQPSDKFWGIIGHCNGLLCVQFHSKETDFSCIVFWNPSTKEYKKFLLPECRGRKAESLAFGYDSMGDDYKVLLVTTILGKLINIQSLSLNMGLWKTVKNNIPYKFQLCGTTLAGRHVDGCIYWIIGCQRGLVYGYRIVCFDLCTDTVREEESLSGILSNKSTYDRLVLSGECLCLVRIYEYVRFDVWRMKEDEVTKIKFWIKLYTLDNFTTPLDPRKKDRIFPVCFTGNGKVLIFSREKKEYALYNLNDQSVQKVAESGIRYLPWFPYTPYVEGLVSPYRQIQ